MTIQIAASATLAALAGVADDASQAPIIVIGRREEADSAAQVEVNSRPGGGDLVTADEYDDRLAVSLRDTLAFSPGVYTQPRFGQEVRISIRGSGLSRGFHMRGLTLLQDGVPINLADDNGDFQELDPLVFAHLQVYRGANALRFGGSALGGAINAVTSTGRTAPGWDLRLDGGSFETVRGKAAFGYADEAGDAWLAITGDRSDGERQHSRRHSLRFNGNAALRLGSAVESRFYVSLNHIDQELPGALPYGIALRRPRTGNFFGDQKRDIDSMRFQNRTSIGLGGNAGLEIGGFYNAKQLFHPIFQVISQNSDDYGMFARLDWSGGPLALTLGGTARFGRTDAKRFVNVSGGRGAPTFRARQRAHTLNLYGEGRLKLLPELTGTVGAVLTTGKREQDQSLPVRIEAERQFDQLSPKLGLLWEPRKDLQLYANYSRSAELPGFGELAQIAAFVPLDSQRAWTGEIGGRGRLGIAAFDISLYRADLRGELLQFTVGPDIPASTFNAGRTRHQGVEAGLNLAFAPWALLRQVYQYSDFRFRNDRQYGGNRLPVIPKHAYRAQFRLGTERLNVAPVVEWVPQGAWADYANTFRTQSYVLLGATAEAAVREGVSLFVDARNLANEKAVGDVSAVVNYAALSPAQRSIFYPVERRAIYGGVRARF